MTAQELRAWRERAKATQELAAEAVDVNVRTWRRWERGEYPVPKWVAYCLAGVARERTPP